MLLGSVCDSRTSHKSIDMAGICRIAGREKENIMGTGQLVSQPTPETGQSILTPDLSDLVAIAETKFRDWGSSVRGLRTVLGFSPEEFAPQIGVTNRTIRRWESDSNSEKGKLGTEPRPSQRRTLAAIRVLVDTGEPPEELPKHVVEEILKRVHANALKCSVASMRPASTNAPPWMEDLAAILVEGHWAAADTLARRYEQRVTDQPAEVQALFYIRWGIASRRLGKPKEQIRHSERAMHLLARAEQSVDPCRFAQIFNSIGCAETRLRNYSRARYQFNSALGFQADYLPAVYNQLAVSSLQQEPESAAYWDNRLRTGAHGNFDRDHAVMNMSQDRDLDWWLANRNSILTEHQEQGVER